MALGEYAGLNPELLQEHLIDLPELKVMRTLLLLNGNRSSLLVRKRNVSITQQAALFKDVINKPVASCKTLTEQMIQKEAIRNGGNYKVATQTVAKYWQNLAENGSLSVIEAQAILDKYVDTRAGRKRLGDTPQDWQSYPSCCYYV